VPGDTQVAVDAVIDPQYNYPGDGTITSASTGDRYLLLTNIPTGDGWAGSNAKANDIIEYDGSNWNVTFDSNTVATEEFTKNLTTKDKLKWTGSQWVNAFEGMYNPGYWRIYL
jgi:hypothetical protein